MAFLIKYNVKAIKNRLDIFKISSSFIHKEAVSRETVNVVKEKSETDMPVEMNNPFTKEKPKCILCKLDLDPDYKNVRLLSQFVSSFTGRIYGRHITGLCRYRQKQVNEAIKKAQTSGLMGVYVKDPNYLEDPSLYDPIHPLRPHPY